MSFIVIGLITVFWRVQLSKTLVKYGTIVTFFFHVLLYGTGFFYFDNLLAPVIVALKTVLFGLGMFVLNGNINDTEAPRRIVGSADRYRVWRMREGDVSFID